MLLVALQAEDASEASCTALLVLDVLVSDRNTCFTSAFWTDLHAALGASLVFGSPHHQDTTSKVECYGVIADVNSVIADVLRSFASE
jgi:hypothetical protein